MYKGFLYRNGIMNDVNIRFNRSNSNICFDDKEITLEEENLIVDEQTGDLVTATKPTDTTVEDAQSEEKRKIVEAKAQSDKPKVEKPREEANVPESNATTQDFRTLVKNKKYKMRIVQEIAQKWEDSPVQFKDGAMSKTASWDVIIDFLKEKGVNTETIGTSDSAIEAWLQKLRCM